VIRFDSVTKRYGDGTVAVGDLTMELADGEITMLVGPSGCGKTTTLRMVNRMIEPTSGSIEIDGRNVMSLPAHELRRGIGYVIQQAGLFPHKRVLDNITTVPRLLGWDKHKAEARARELLELVGLSAAMATRFPSQLSGGQQQRVGVARALAADPPVLLMDEPFGAVDPIQRGQLQQELLRLQRELHKTIVFVTHDIDEAILLGDRICVLSTGATIEQLSTPHEMLARPANTFVADFLGQDRGLKLLSLVSADEVRVEEGTTANGWKLELDDDGRPASWLGPDGEEPVPAVCVGPGESARGLLDAAVSAPSRAAVRTDGHGRLVGIVSYESIGALLAAKLAEAVA
jgi:osmoprotectant transport system ATP-binding protein